MTAISEWAARHTVSPTALAELYALMGAHREILLHPSVPQDIHSEAGVQSLVRLRAAQAGKLVFRNNVGAMEDKNGRVVRFGLANDSTAVNKRIKSCDLIGVNPGGQFWARECKHVGWKFSQNDERAVAQLRFIELINSMGGDAAFTTGEL